MLLLNNSGTKKNLDNKIFTSFASEIIFMNSFIEENRISKCYLGKQNVMNFLDY